MSRIQEAFQNGKAFIPFITCGYPNLETTGKIIRSMAENGADLIELGIPFSDPTAEGPVIQEANLRALQGGITTDMVFDFVGEIRKEVKIPMVFMTYANVVYSYGNRTETGKSRAGMEKGAGNPPLSGVELFMERSAQAGMDGLILPDIPFEEKAEFDASAKKYNLDLISMIAPTSKDRISMIAKEASGFIYIVSSLGVTGVRREITTDIGAMVKLIKENTSVPCAVGFGISTPEQAKKMADMSDGVIVGSAIIKLIAQHGTGSAPVVGEYVRRMKEAIRR